MQSSRSRRGAITRSGLVSNSVWETRIKMDEVKGGIKVFNGDENDGSKDEDGLRVSRRLRRNQSDSVSAGERRRRRNWKPPDPVNIGVNGKNPIQLRKARSELSNSSRISIANCKEFGSEKSEEDDDEEEIEIGIEEKRKSFDDKEIDLPLEKPKNVDQEKKINQIHEIPKSVDVEKKRPPTPPPQTPPLLMDVETKKPPTPPPPPLIDLKANVDVEKKKPPPPPPPPSLIDLKANVDVEKEKPPPPPPLVDLKANVVVEKKPPPPPVVDLKTKKPDLVKPRQIEVEEEISENVPGTQNRVQNIVDLIMWEDISKSAFVFGFGTFFLLSSSYAKDLNFSLISAISYLGLVYLALIFLYKSILHRGSMEFNERDERFMVGEEEAIWALRFLLPYVNEVLFKVRALFSGDPSTTMKLAVVLFVMARCGSSITTWTLAKLVFFGVFTVPKVLSSYSLQLARYGKFWLDRFGDGWESCTHKKAVAAALFTVVWNMSSTVARIWCAFMLIVAVKFYQECMAKEWNGSEEEEEEEEVVVVEEDRQEDFRRELRRQRGGGGPKRAMEVGRKTKKGA